jgi:hypothetical protein
VSRQATDWAFDVRGLDPWAQLVLLHLANHHNGQTGRCDPSLVGLAEGTGMSKRAVQDKLALLDDRGLITRQRTKGGKGHRTSYLLHIQTGHQLPRLTEETEQELPRSTGETGHQATANRAPDDTQTGHQLPPNQELNQELNQEGTPPRALAKANGGAAGARTVKLIRGKWAKGHRDFEGFRYAFPEVDPDELARIIDELEETA